MNKEFILAIEDLEKERDISKDVMIKTLEQALVSACKKNYGKDQNVEVNIDRETGDIEVILIKEVVSDEDVMSEEEISNNEEPIVCFEFQKREAYGFNVWTDDGIPCFFFCVGIPDKGNNNLLTVLVSAPDNDELQNLIDFVEEYLSVK